MKTGLLIHSYNCNEPNWEHTVWGYFPDRPGRLVTATREILEGNIDIALICGTAGGKDGKIESWWMKDRLYRGLEELKDFTIFPVFQQYNSQDLKEKLDRVLVIKKKDTGATTAGEAEYAGRFFTEAGIEKVRQVTSPDHVSRAIRDAIIAWQENYPRLIANLSIATSVTLYSVRPGDEEIAKMENVIIAEPPVMKKFNLARIFGVLNNPDALAEIDSTLRKYGK